MVPLLEAQADLEARDFSGATPLLRAVLAGRFGVAALLLGRGASPSTPTFSGATPLWATRALAADSEAEGCATAHAALAGLLLDHAPAGIIERVAGAPPLGFTLLYMAAQHGDETEIEWLLSEGVQVDAPAQDGATPLQAACAFGAPGATALLLAHEP